jgi:hypothetical protein
LEQKKGIGNFSFDFLLSFQKCQRWRKLATASREQQKKATASGQSTHRVRYNCCALHGRAGHRKIFSTLLLLFVQVRWKKWEIVYSAVRAAGSTREKERRWWCLKAKTTLCAAAAALLNFNSKLQGEAINKFAPNFASRSS